MKELRDGGDRVLQGVFFPITKMKNGKPDQSNSTEEQRKFADTILRSENTKEDATTEVWEDGSGKNLEEKAPI